MQFPRVARDITGMVNTTYALNNFCMMLRFRESAKTCIQQMVTIYDDVLLDDAAKQYKEFVLDVFYGAAPEHRDRRATLLKMAPGDWRVRGDYAWKRMGDETVEQVSDMLADVLLPLLYAHAPFEFPRNRWTGLDKTMADHGVPCCLHNLHAECFVQYRLDMGERLAAGAARPPHEHLVAVGDSLVAGALEDGGLDDLDAPEPEVPAGDGRGDPLPLDPAVAAASVAAKENKGQRDKAHAWMMTFPADRLLGI
eukprot:5448304-Pyramimonas_sp.AAC.1